VNIPVVTTSEWEAARAKLLAKEKEATQALDRLAAERRRLPMVEVAGDYRFVGPDGDADFVDLLAGRRQLIVYHFMFDPAWDAGCVGCSGFVDNIGELAHLNARDTSFVLVSRAPFATLEAYQQRMGWQVPWYSSYGSAFNYDFGTTTADGESFALTVFWRDGERILQTYRTSLRGVDRLRLDFNLLDLTPLGRQEEWEDSPAGRPQSPAYTWWRRHDEYPAGEEGWEKTVEPAA